MKTIYNMQSLTDWIQPGNVGDTGGGSVKPNGIFLMLPRPTATFIAAGAYPYNNGYFYRNVPEATSAMTYFEYGFQLSFPRQQDIDACQAFEFELQQNTGGHIYNMAYQFDLKGSKLVRTFDYTNQIWVPTNIPAGTPTAGVINTIVAKFLRQGNYLTHISLKINNDADYVVNVTRPAFPKVERDYVHAAFQLDSTDPAQAYMVEVSNMYLTMMDTAV